MTPLESIESLLRVFVFSEASKKRGNVMTFETLLQRVHPTLKAITYKLNHRYTYFDEDDLYQEATTHLWEKNEYGFWEDKTESYILQSCYYFLKNYIRKAYKSLDKNCLSLDAEYGEGSPHAIADIISYPQKDRTPHIMDAHLFLSEIEPMLSGRERNIFMMYLDGFTTREIGNILGISHVMVIKIEKKIRGKYAHISEEFLLN